jgi:hypothetical protein
MYWRISSIDVENKPTTNGRVPELYLTTDDYAHFIKFDPDDRSYPWCLMQPFGTRYGAHVVERFFSFERAFKRLQEIHEQDNGT